MKFEPLAVLGSNRFHDLAKLPIRSGIRRFAWHQRAHSWLPAYAHGGPVDLPKVLR